jgi:hypothetical protein
MTAMTPNPEITSVPTPENPTPNHNYFRKSVAALVAAGVLLGGGYKLEDHENQLEHKITSLQQTNESLQSTNRLQAKAIANISSEIADMMGVTTETVTGAGLKDITKTPGYGKEVSPKDKEQMRAATVKIVSRPKGSNQGWEDTCTGLKVTIGGNVYVSTAGHCLKYINPDTKGGADPNSRSYNATTLVSDDYAVQVLASDNKRGPVLPVSEISQSLNQDWALMKIPKEANSSGYDAIKPVDFSAALNSHAKESAQIGQSAVVYSLPDASNGKVLRGDGVYLGTAINVLGDSKGYEYIGLKNADTPGHDACNFGASGASALIADGHATGPASERDLIGYKDKNTSLATFNFGDLTSDKLGKNTLKIEQALGVNLRPFDVVCGFAIGDPEVAKDLVAGFAVAPAPIYYATPK